MDYQNIYNRLTSNKEHRSKSTGLYETHHIRPRAFGGSDEQNNLVLLTPREHFIAHLLLSRLYGGKMTYALFLMSSKKKYTNRSYGNIREEFANTLRTNKTRGKRISDALTGKCKTDQHKLRWKESRTNGAGWVVSERHRKNLSKQRTGSGNAMYGKTHSDESRQKIRDANAKKVECPHCGKIGGIAIMPRWHFENCKFKVDKNTET